MSTRWMAVQYVGNTLRLPVVNEGDMNKPFGSSVVERKISRVVINPFSDNPQVFVPESENAKLRELVKHLRECTRHNVCAACKYAEDACDFDYDMRELGVDVP